MEPWAVETVTELLDQRPVAARIRFSTSENVAQVDIYRRETFSPVLEWQLEHRGWQFAGAYEGLPDGVIGHYYRHHAINRQRLRRTREHMLQFMERIVPTAQAVALPHRPVEAPKLPWRTPLVVEIGCISAAKSYANATIMWIFDEDADDFDLEERAVICAMHLGDRCFEFSKPMTFSAGWYGFEATETIMRVFSMEGIAEPVVAKEARKSNRAVRAHA